MLPLLLLVVVVVVVWRLSARGGQFLPGFSCLLTEATVQRGPFSFFSGRSYAVGKFQGRDVALRLQLKRGKYAQGYLVVAIRTGGPPMLDYTGIDARTRDDAMHAVATSLEAGG